ncbi:MAG: TM2 domain-containing protein [Gemmatimonadales bacterium]
MTDDLFASPKSRLVAQLLAVFLGVFGAHRFYVGKVQSGILQACTLGGLGLWYLYDNILIAAGSFRDADGNLVANWEPETDRLIPRGRPPRSSTNSTPSAPRSPSCRTACRSPSG